MKYILIALLVVVSILSGYMYGLKSRPLNTINKRYILVPLGETDSYIQFEIPDDLNCFTGFRAYRNKKPNGDIEYKGFNFGHETIDQTTP